MADVVALMFPESIRKMGIRLADIEAFDAEPLPQIWDDREPDKKELMDWLDANAPGWKTKLRKLGHREIEIPIGIEGSGVFMYYDVSVLFPQYAQREAYRAWKQNRHEEYEKKQAYIDDCIENAPEGVQICYDCGKHMRAFESEETMRVAQFAFTLKREAWKCDCGMEMSAAAPDALFAAADLAEPLIGLPSPDSEGWSEEVQSERIRRRKQPPVATVRVDYNMSAQDVIDALKAELAKQN